jgi:hypothetical protein
MKRILIAAYCLAAGAAAEAQSAPASWKGFQRGVRWEKSLDDAKARAAREGKPVLLYQLVGNLAKEGC